MKIAGAFIENRGLSSYEAIFMQSGEPKDHEISARNDSLEGFLRRLFYAATWRDKLAATTPWRDKLAATTPWRDKLAATTPWRGELAATTQN